VFISVAFFLIEEIRAGSDYLTTKSKRALE